MTDGELERLLQGRSMTEIIRLQDRLSAILRARFGRTLCLLFTDIVGSTRYFQTYGDEAGRRLQQRHFDAVSGALVSRGGRIVDTAGDGAFCVVPDPQAGAEALTALMRAVAKQNATLPTGHHLRLRCGLHWGQVLTDGDQVSGDAVNLAARVAGAADIDTIRVTRQVYDELDPPTRMRCKSKGAVALKGVAASVEQYELTWPETSRFPQVVRIAETGQIIELAHKPTLTFGRLDFHEGQPANDIVLSLPDSDKARKISRWHFELKRGPRGFLVKAVSRGRTVVDGAIVQRGEQAPINVGSKVELSGVLTLVFENQSKPEMATIFGSTVYAPD